MKMMFLIIFIGRGSPMTNRSVKNCNYDVKSSLDKGLQVLKLMRK